MPGKEVVSWTSMSVFRPDYRFMQENLNDRLDDYINLWVIKLLIKLIQYNNKIAY